jgi:hypothetical protein
LVNAKKEGLSFQELNEFRVRDYIEFVNIYVGNKRPGKATQVDIDKLLA